MSRTAILVRAEKCVSSDTVEAGQSVLTLLLWTEAIVRGHKAGLLTVPDYNNLCQCETLDDIKLHLVRAWLSGSAGDPQLPRPVHTLCES